MNLYSPHDSILSILGVQFFGKKFYKCTLNGEKLSSEEIFNKTQCIQQYGEVAWQNSKINFDNTVMAFFALYQVVCIFVPRFVLKASPCSIYNFFLILSSKIFWQ